MRLFDYLLFPLDYTLFKNIAVKIEWDNNYKVFYSEPDSKVSAKLISVFIVIIGVRGFSVIVYILSVELSFLFFYF